MTNKIQSNVAEVVVRLNIGGSWSIEMPHAERADAVFITFANDRSEALYIATQMRPDAPVQIITPDTEVA
jgi:hypothetical protein